MSSAPPANTNFRISIDRELDIDAPPEIVFQSVLEEMNSIPSESGKSINLKLEAMPGGRWYRDLGNNTGHLWGHVQVIKPPTLLEITGPLMMSLPVINHITYRITASGQGSHLSIKHRAFGDIDSRMQEGLLDGWTQFLNGVKAAAQSRRG